MLDIIVLTYNHLDLTKRCLESIDTSHPYKLIVVDSGSVDGTAEYCSNKGADVVLTSGEFNFANNVNLGVRTGSSKYKLICNNDIEFTKGAIDGMLKVMQENKAGMVGPCSNGVMNPDQKILLKDAIRTTRTLNFFCVLIDKLVFNVVGYMDPIFSGYGCDDDDFCIRALRCGFKLLVAPVFVKHEATATYKDLDKRKLFNDNKKRFREKWNSVPAQDWEKVGLV